MKPQSGAGRRVLLKAAAAVALALSVSSASLAQEREIKVGYMKNPIQDASLDIMDKWAKANNVKLTRIPMAYSVFMEKVTATLTSGADQFDMIWHNDDWGQLWKKWLEPTDDVKGIENAGEWPLLAFWNDDKKLTTVPMAHTVGTFFYRKDLVKESEVPKTFDELVTISQRLQKEGKVKWGYVGGMSMNNTWFSFWWTMWANQCDILKPMFERDNEQAQGRQVRAGRHRALPSRNRRVLVGRDQHPQDQPTRHDRLRPQRSQRHLHGRRCGLHAGGLDALWRVQRSQALQDRRQRRHGPFPGRPARQSADLLERNLGLGHSDRRAGGEEEARQGDARPP